MALTLPKEQEISSDEEDVAVSLCSCNSVSTEDTDMQTGQHRSHWRHATPDPTSIMGVLKPLHN